MNAKIVVWSDHPTEKEQAETDRGATGRVHNNEGDVGRGHAGRRLRLCGSV